MNTTYFCIFAGRHPLPNNPKPLYNEAESYDVSNMAQYRNKANFAEFVRLLKGNKPVTINVYVTGFTPATIDMHKTAIAEVLKNGTPIKVQILHFNNKTGEYSPQQL